MTLREAIRRRISLHSETLAEAYLRGVHDGHERGVHDERNRLAPLADQAIKHAAATAAHAFRVEYARLWHSIYCLSGDCRRN